MSIGSKDISERAHANPLYDYAEVQAAIIRDGQECKLYYKIDANILITSSIREHY